MSARIVKFTLLAFYLFLPFISFASEEKEGKDIDYVDIVIEHISDANEFHIFGDVHIPLPCILYSKDNGLEFFMSSRFNHGHDVVSGYVLDHGDVKRIKDYSEDMHLEHIDSTGEVKEGESVIHYAYHHGERFELERPSTLLTWTSWVDFSITKNVFSMLLVALIMIFIWITVAKSYKKREGKAPKGIQSLFEPLFTFIRDEVVQPTIGPKYERYMPFIMSLFFFVLFCNLFGMIPFFPGSANVTGNLATTLALALFTALITNFSGNRHYWQHIFWMPGVPIPVRFILAPIEFAGVFIKPFTLFIRLFANITAGHTIILCLVGMVFILGDMGESPGGAAVGGGLAVFFVLIMSLLELLVAFIQAFIFALLSSLYIGMAVEEHHEDHH